MSDRKRIVTDAPPDASAQNSPQTEDMYPPEQVAESPGREHSRGLEQHGPGRGRRILKWVAFVVGLLFFLGVLREAMDPFGDEPYIEISHGDHVHYVPEDRDPNVPINRFPTIEPAADERITPDGRVVKQE